MIEVKLIDPKHVKKDVQIVMSYEMAEELCTFIGRTSNPERKKICSVEYNDEIVEEFFYKLSDIVPSRK
jgi:hypothetical protein